MLKLSCQFSQVLRAAGELPRPRPPTLGRRGREAGAEQPGPRAAHPPGAAAESGEPGAAAGKAG